MNTAPTKIAGEAMTDEQIIEIAAQHVTPDGWMHGELIMSFALALLASKPAVPEGWKMVPVKPTSEIVKAGGKARVDDFNRNGTTLSPKDANRVAEAMYRAMIAASPAPASPSGEPGMTNGDFHCPACGSVMKGPISCGSCLWERDTCGYALAASPSGEDAAEQADEAVTLPEPFKSPLTSFGLLVRALRIVAGTTLYDMAKALSSTPATLSAVECGRKPLTEEMVIDTYVFFTKLGVLDTLHALNAARAKDSK